MAKRRPKYKPTHEEQMACESDLEQTLHTILTHHKFPTFFQQYIFHATRKWRFDFAFLTHKVAIEVQGYGPGHTSLPGMTNDYEKHNAAVLCGWIIIYVMNHDLNDHKHNTIILIKDILESRIPGSTKITYSSPTPTGHYSVHIETARRRLDQIINQQKRG